MSYYISYGDFQQHMKEYYQRTGNRMQFNEMTDYLYKKNLLGTETPPALSPNVSTYYDVMTDDEFNKIVDNFVLTLYPSQGAPLQSTVKETDIIPNRRDVFIIRHPRYTRRKTHRHNYFEINYVAHGTCDFHFENSVRTLHEGELCIIAPSSEHDLIINDDSTVFCLMLRKSTFDTCFFSLLSRNDLLSYFFRTILQDDSHANYLLFFTKDNRGLKRIVRNLMGECHRADAYSNSCCISWVNLLFSTLLRNYSQTLQFYDRQNNTDFSLVLQYIQHNYQTLTLSSLAQLFHYSEPHLCTLIKQNTGYTFTELIKRLRLSDAVRLLENTELKVSEIAEQIGYNSSDHFSRVFRTTYKVSPQEYRKTHKNDENQISPFFMEEEK